jgi:hypothetical protein
LAGEPNPLALNAKTATLRSPDLLKPSEYDMVPHSRKARPSSVDAVVEHSSQWIRDRHSGALPARRKDRFAALKKEIPWQRQIFKSRLLKAPDQRLSLAGMHSPWRPEAGGTGTVG